MKIQIGKELSEMLHFMAKFHQVDLVYLVDQLLLNEIHALLGDAEYYTPRRAVTFFESNEYPCELGENVENYYQWFKEIKETQVAFVNWDSSKKMQELTKDYEGLVHAKPIVIDCFHNITS